MNAILIESTNQLINLDQVTDAKFSPARDYTYEDEDDYDEQGNMKVKQGHDDAWLDLTMTSTEDKIISGYDGEFLGVVAVSREIRVHGVEAEILWKFSRTNYRLVSRTGLEMGSAGWMDPQ